RLGIRHVHDRAGARLDLLIVEHERRVPLDDEVDLLVTGRYLVVRDDHDPVAPREPRIDPEGLDPELPADGNPARDVLDLPEMRGTPVGHAPTLGTVALGRDQGLASANDEVASLDLDQQSTVCRLMA